LSAFTNIPFGAALGIFKMWVLRPRESEQEYEVLASAGSRLSLAGNRTRFHTATLAFHPHRLSDTVLNPLRLRLDAIVMAVAVARFCSTAVRLAGQSKVFLSRERITA
jgi:hypothetical protein